MSKYRAVKTVIDGIVFHSKKEARRYMQLKLLERAGEISNLELQPIYEFTLADKKIFIYKADFSYLDRKTNELIVEDVKGYKTPVYRLKKKLIENQHHIEIWET
jgi:hypothetical protein